METTIKIGMVLSGSQTYSLKVLICKSAPAILNNIGVYPEGLGEKGFHPFSKGGIPMVILKNRTKV